MSNSKKKNQWLIWSLAVAAIIFIGFKFIPQPASNTSGEAPAEIRIAYQSIPNADLLVKHNAMLEKAFPNTKITWVKFESGGDVNTAMLAGSVDFGLVGSSPVTRGLSEPNNIDYSVLWIHDVIGSAESLVVRNDLGITSVAELKGKTIATPFASTSHYSLLAAITEAGLSASDVKLIDLQPLDIQAAWERGDIDAAYVWSPTLDEIKKTGTVLATSAELAQKGYPTYDLGVVANTFAKKYPLAVQQWLKVEDQAVQELQANPSAAAEAIAAELGITGADVQAQFAGLIFLNAQDQTSDTYFGTSAKPGQFAAGLLKAGQFLLEQQKIDAAPTLAHLTESVDTKDLDAAFK